jgi:hypothetical protein
MKLSLQNIVSDISFNNLPEKWEGFNFNRFSKDKTLFDFQSYALQNALKGLWLYFKDKNGDNQSLFRHYHANGFEQNFDYNLNRERKAAKYLLEYESDYPVIDSKISFAHFINRMSFWMATGSGKTLIIVKLIELLGKLIAGKEIPANDILFLAHRDDLLEQFKNHVDQFNSFNFKTRINLKSLKDYESVKHENTLPFTKNEITVFYYRSDLISDEHKEKIVDFRNYDNKGKWYILLDEAHKGDKEDSKRQILYSILSRNGFLFNFSATFTDPRDYATCVFNFNLSKFIEEGYGKHIYLSQSEVSAFRDKTDFSPVEKQKIVIKTLILLTYINKYFVKVRNKESTLYHRPLLLTLVNSVDIKDSDLELFFAELEKVAKNEIGVDTFKKAKEELIKELESCPKYEFEDLKFIADMDLISALEYEDLLKHIFNAKTSGNIEVLKIPGNRNELIFKLQTAEKPFALIKIGDISGWLKEKLEGYEINESYDNESLFKKINHDDSDINILMGSRAFYEGWDSNRPNLILFVNIGVGSDAKKFVLQSVGRGVRIEPQKNKRKRIQNLFNTKEIDEQLFNKVQKLILPIESLFIFGTNVENLKEIIKTLQEEKQDKDLGGEFILNKEAEKHLLLVPVYKDSNKIFAEEKEPQKYSLSNEDFELTKKFYNFVGDKVALAKYECEIKVLNKTKESLNIADKYYDFESEKRSIAEPELILDRIFKHFAIKGKEFDKFKKLEDEIVHFKRIRFSGEQYNNLIEKINRVKNYSEKKKQIQQLKLDFEEHKDINKYTEAIQDIEKEYVKESVYEYNTKKIKIKYLANHYYIPLILSETDKIDYINHIINIESEVRFVEQLEKHINKDDNIFKKFDWWLFSKLDQTLDEVYIPYYNPKENDIAKFKPDFIFWMQKGNEYTVLFVDPKGTSFADYQHKVDDFKRIFEEEVYSYESQKIHTNLLLYTNDISKVGEGYKKYWFDNFLDFSDKIK